MRKFKEKHPHWTLMGGREKLNYILLDDNNTLFGIGIDGAKEQLKLWSLDTINLFLEDKTLIEITDVFATDYLDDI